MSPEQSTEAFADQVDRAYDQWKSGEPDERGIQWPGHDRPSLLGADIVNHPAHYTVGGIEVWDYLKMKLTAEELRGYCKGNILKYVSRAKYKGDEVKDVKKAAWYAKRLEEIIT